MIEPLHKPLQVIFVSVGVAVSVGGEVIVNVTVFEHPSASAALIEYVPAHKFVMIEPVATPVGVIVYVNGGVPPVAVTVALPSHTPPQFILVLATVTVVAGGCNIFAV